MSATYCINAILRGETDVLPGGVFMSESENCGGFAVFCYCPAPDSRMPCENFKLIFKGPRGDCETALAAKAGGAL